MSQQPELYLLMNVCHSDFVVIKEPAYWELINTKLQFRRTRISQAI